MGEIRNWKIFSAAFGFTSLLLAGIFNVGSTQNASNLACSGVGDTGTQLCCQGILLPKPSSTHACCGSTSYDTNDHICCEDIIHRKIFASYACCGPDPYDTDLDLCCQGSIQWMPSSDWICCGNRSYSVAISMCCEDAVQYQPFPHYVCCGKQSYNSNIQTCCADGTVQYIGECGDGRTTREIREMNKTQTVPNAIIVRVSNSPNSGSRRTTWTLLMVLSYLITFC